MKKSLLTLLLACLIHNAFSQKLVDGLYIFENKSKRISIYKNPELISVALLDKKSLTQQNGLAILKPIPENIGLNDGISYVFKSDSCFYEFDFSKTTLNLYATQCKNNIKDSRMIFTKKSFMTLVKLNEFIEQQNKKIKIK